VEIVKPYRSNNKKIFSSREPTLISVEMVLLWLVAVDGVCSAFVGMAFGGIGRTTVSRIVDHVTFAVIQCWKSEVTWPDEDERRDTYGMLSCYEKAVGIMDGTHCEIEVPKWDEYGFFSGLYQEYIVGKYGDKICCLMLLVVYTIAYVD